MPNFDGTGPNGQGPTGGQQGPCQNNESTSRRGRGLGPCGKGQAFGRGAGRGRGLGRGKGLGRGRALNNEESNNSQENAE